MEEITRFIFTHKIINYTLIAPHLVSGFITGLEEIGK
jgi:hypothetical protein